MLTGQAFVSIFKHDVHRAVYISSDAGRLCRPLVIVEKGRSLIREKHLRDLENKLTDFDTLVSEGLVPPPPPILVCSIDVCRLSIWM